MLVRIFSLILVFTPVVPATLFAAEVSVSGPNQARVGQSFSVSLLLNTENETINTAQALLEFDATMLEAQSISSQNSIFNLWAEQPVFSNTNGTVSFAGGLPTPGFNGDTGRLVTVTFIPLKTGVTTLLFGSDTRVLLNDGQGSDATVTTRPLTISILEPLPPAQQPSEPQVEEVEDITPPEPFTPMISQSPAAFDGEYFLVFDTSDTESGIDYYEVQEIVDGVAGEWQRVTSPYIPTIQEGEAVIRVKAVDKVGNERVHSIAYSFTEQDFVSFKFQQWISWLLMFVILVLALLLVYVYRKLHEYEKKKSRKKNTKK